MIKKKIKSEEITFVVCEPDRNCSNKQMNEQSIQAALIWAMLNFKSYNKPEVFN